MNTVISIKTDKATKEAAQEVAKSMGLNLSVLVNSYLKQVVYTRRVELFAPEQMSSAIAKGLDKVEKEIKAGHVSEVFTDSKSFLASLRK
jgi:addiction module RelB/DinJ family antitoxin